MRKALSLILVFAICLSLVACGKSKEVIAVEKLIAAIGEVTDQSGEAIQKAEDAVAVLSAEEQESIELLSELTEARKKYDEISAIRSVEILIERIGDVGFDSEGSITVARTTYDALDSALKDQASNYNDLHAAEQKFSDIRVKEVVEQINAIDPDSIVLSDTVRETIDGIYTKYNALSEEEQRKVGNYETLSAAKDSYNEMWVHSLVKIEKIWLTHYRYSNEIDLNIDWVNKSSKTIKYIKFDVAITNSVGDYLIWNGYDFNRYTLTGPFESNKRESECWNTMRYRAASEVGWPVVSQILIEYMDGSKATITEENVQFALP